jgi:hypothetical protein
VTCNHVYEALLIDRRKCPTLTCQIGNVPFDESTVLDSDKVVDLATFPIGQTVPTERVHRAEVWPRQPLRAGESVMPAGFPGVLRTVQDSDTMRSDFVAFLAKAETPSDSKMALRIDDTYWPEGSDTLPPQVDLGGMSGGPVFRRRSDAVDDIEVAAFVYEAHASATLELLYSVQAWRVMADGRINRAKQL